MALLCLALEGCSLGASSHAAATAGKSGASSSGASRMVYIRNQKGADEFGFSPHTITVKAGSRVTWVNRSAQPHTVTSASTPALFDSGTKNLINPKHNWSHLFRHPGKYRYYCLLHPYMTGFVIVRS